MNKETHVTKKLSLLCMGVVMLMLLLVGRPMHLQAATTKAPTCEKSHTFYMRPVYPGYEDTQSPDMASQFIYIKNAAKSAKVYDLKFSKGSPESLKYDLYTTTSNNSIYKNDKNKPIAIYLPSSFPYQYKDGYKTTMTFKVKQNGKVYKLSCKLTFKTAPSPFASFKLGSYGYGSKGYYSTIETKSKLSGKKVKISVKMKSGYKLDYIEISNGEKSRKVKNNSTVTLKKNDCITARYSLAKRPVNSPSNILTYFASLDGGMHNYFSIRFK